MIFYQLLFWFSFLLLFVAYVFKCIMICVPDGFDDIARTSPGIGVGDDDIITSKLFDDKDRKYFGAKLQDNFYKICHDRIKDETKNLQINIDNVTHFIAYISARQFPYSSIKMYDKPSSSGCKIFHISEIILN